MASAEQIQAGGHAAGIRKRAKNRVRLVVIVVGSNREVQEIGIVIIARQAGITAKAEVVSGKSVVHVAAIVKPDIAAQAHRRVSELQLCDTRQRQHHKAKEHKKNSYSYGGGALPRKHGALPHLYTTPDPEPLPPTNVCT